MHTRRLGNSDLQITLVGFGAWAIGGGDWLFGWGPQDDADSVTAIHRAVDLGINWVDTAAVVRPRALRGGRRAGACASCRRRGGRTSSRSRAWCGTATRRSVAQPAARFDPQGSRRKPVSASASMSIDLYQIHWPRWGARRPDGTRARSKKAGRTIERPQKGRQGPPHRRRRTSRGPTWTPRPAVAPVTSLQPPYSLLRRDIEQDVLPWCLAHGIGVIVYSPMQSGLLTGTMTRERLRGAGAQRLAQEGQVLPGAVLDAGTGAGGAADARWARRTASRPSEMAIAWTLTPSGRHRRHRRRPPRRTARRHRRRGRSSRSSDEDMRDDSRQYLARGIVRRAA